MYLDSVLHNFFLMLGSQNTPKVFLFVLQHGSHGSAYDWENVKAALLAKWKSIPSLESVPVEVFSPRNNEYLRTDRGVLRCGERLAFDLAEEIRTVKERHPSAELHLSCVGHSFGGPLLRHALMTLHIREQLSGVDLVTFATLASPHLGVRQMNACLRLGARLAGNVFSTAYADLALSTTALDALCAEEALSPLRRFHRRLLFANVRKDPLVALETAGLVVRDELSATALSEPAATGGHMCQMITLQPPGSNAAALWSMSKQICSSFDDRTSQRATRVADMLCSLRSVGSWCLYPVNFAERLATAHGAIIQHPSTLKNPRGLGMDVTNCLVEQLCSDAVVAMGKMPACTEPI